MTATSSILTCVLQGGNETLPFPYLPLHHIICSIPVRSCDVFGHPRASRPYTYRMAESFVLRAWSAVPSKHNSFATSSVVRIFSNQHTTEPSGLESKCWKPTWLRAAPLLGLAALGIAFTSIFASLAVLLLSQDSPVAHWKFSPSTYLAIITAVTNQSIRYSTVTGTIIAWWLRAIKGSTMLSLHWDWAMSVRLTKALSSGKRFNILARACICSTLIAIDGPLLQRASSVTHVSYRNPTTLGVTLSPEVPHGYSGEYKAVRASLIGVPENFGTADAYELLMNPDFSPILAEWAGGDPISIKLDSGSPDQISAHIQAPALARRRCRTSHFSGDYTELQNGRPTNVSQACG